MCTLLRRALLTLAAVGAAIGSQRQWVRLLDQAAFTVAVNPHNPRTLFVGGLGNQLFRSYDGGRHWDTIIIDFPGGASQFLDVFLHPRDTSVLLVGGSGFGKLVRSSDGGQTWQDVLVPPHAFILPSGASIVAHPLYPDTVMVTEYIGPGWTPPRLYRSTDGGRSWDTLDVFPDAIPNCAMAVRWDSLWLVVARCDGALFVSRDWRTWQQLTHLRLPGYPQESEIPDLVFVPEVPGLGFLAVTFLFDTVVGGRPNGGLYRTTDGGSTWQLIAFPDTSLWAVATYWRSPTALEVAVGGFTLYPDTLGNPLVPGSGIVRTSPDGGQSWQAHDAAIPWVADQILYRRVWRLKYSPTGTLYVATELGLYAWEEATAVELPPPAAASPHCLLLPDRSWQLSLPCSGTLSLWNSTGAQVMAQRLSAGVHRLDLQHLVPGLYTATVVSCQGLYSRWLLLLP